MFCGVNGVFLSLVCVRVKGFTPLSLTHPTVSGPTVWSHPRHYLLLVYRTNERNMKLKLSHQWRRRNRNVCEPLDIFQILVREGKAPPPRHPSRILHVVWLARHCLRGAPGGVRTQESDPHETTSGELRLVADRSSSSSVSHPPTHYRPKTGRAVAR